MEREKRRKIIAAGAENPCKNEELAMIKGERKEIIATGGKKRQNALKMREKEGNIRAKKWKYRG